MITSGATRVSKEFGKAGCQKELGRYCEVSNTREKRKASRLKIPKTTSFFISKSLQGSFLYLIL